MPFTRHSSSSNNRAVPGRQPLGAGADNLRGAQAAVDADRLTLIDRTVSVTDLDQNRFDNTRFLAGHYKLMGGKSRRR